MNFEECCDAIRKLDDIEKRKIHHIIIYINNYNNYNYKLTIEEDNDKKSFYKYSKKYYEDLAIINYEYYLKSKERKWFDPPLSPPPPESPPPSPPASPINASLFSPVTSPDMSVSQSNKRERSSETESSYIEESKKIKVTMPDLE